MRLLEPHIRNIFRLAGRLLLPAAKKIHMRQDDCFLHSPAADNVLLEAAGTTIVGRENGDILVGDGTNELNMKPGHDEGINLGTSSLSFLDLFTKGIVCFGDFSVVTVSSNAITISRSIHRVNNTGIGNLQTINGATRAGQVLGLLRNTANNDTTVESGADNIDLAGGVDFDLDDQKDLLVLMWDGFQWIEVCRASNG